MGVSSCSGQASESFYASLGDIVQKKLSNGVDAQVQRPCDSAGRMPHNLDYLGGNKKSEHPIPEFLEIGEKIDWPITTPRIFDIDPSILKHFGTEVDLDTLRPPSSPSSISYFDTFYGLNLSRVPRKMAIFSDVWVDRYGLVAEQRQHGCRSVQLGKCPPCQRPFDTSKAGSMAQVPVVVSLATCYSGIWHYPMEDLIGLANIDLNRYPFNIALYHVPLRSPYILGWMKLIGIPPERIIDVSVPAKVLLAPELGACGHPLRPQLEWLIERLRPPSSSENSTHPTIVFIQRTGRRRVPNNEEVKKVLSAFAAQHHMKFVVHSDQHLPPLDKQIEMFSKATFVVGPHGAGELFVAFMQRGGYVLEVSPDQNRAHHCYSRLSYVLGHNYKQTLLTAAGIDIPVLKATMETFFEDYNRHASRNNSVV